MSHINVIDGVLHLSRIQAKKLDINLMGDIQQSYLTYLNTTYQEDIEYLNSLLEESSTTKNLRVRCHLGELEEHTYSKTLIHEGKYYYPVRGDFILNGEVVGREFELLRIPYMDDYGKINVDGMSKVVLSILRSSEDISYNLKLETFNIAMPHANIRITSKKGKVCVIYGKDKYPVIDLIAAMLNDIGDEETNLADLFCSTFLRNAIKVSPYTLSSYVAEAFNSRTNFLEKLKSPQYKLGRTRDALNQALSLDRAVGEVLSRDVLNYTEGTTITEGMVREFKRARINTVYVRDLGNIEGYRLCDMNQVMPFYNSLPAGTPNCTLLRRELPQYEQYSVLPEDVFFDRPLIIQTQGPLTQEVAEFIMLSLGEKCLMVHPGDSSTVKFFSFEREIHGNYTARLRELTDNIPAGRRADEWVYFYNNPNLDAVDDQYMTVHDFIAITSVIGQINTTGVSPLLNRDTSYLKKVLMINEVFSETLRNTMKTFVKQHRSAIERAAQNATSENPFAMLTSSWLSTLNQERYVAPANTLNLVSEVSQVCHINTIMPAAAEVVDEMRQIAMPFLGRLCPYETPAGKKLGLVNTKALYSRVENGLQLAPYRKVIKTADGIRISDKITWLSVKDELGHKFSDPLGFEYDDNNKILNTPILARVPNPDVSDEPFVFSTISAYDLVDNYVLAYPEQGLSPTIALVPFACSDDPTRLTFGASQICQMLYLYKSQRPRVKTSMRDDIFSYSDVVRYTAPCDGTVTAMDNVSITVKSTDGESHEVYLQKKHVGSRDVTLDVLVSIGDRVKSGSVLAEMYKYPQPFVVRAPFAGKVIAITKKEIQISKNFTNSMVMNLDDVDYISIQDSRIMGQTAVFLNIHVSVGDIVEKGQLLADTCMSRGGTYTPTRHPLVGYLCNGYNYEDGVCATERASINYTSISTHHIDKKISKKRYKANVSFVTNGFKYCGPGDVVGSIKQAKEIGANVDHIANVRATVKASGIPFERETMEDTNDYRIYRYHLLSFNRLRVGDKMSGFHGNKGVVSYTSEEPYSPELMRDSKAPQLLNGKTLEFMLNPCGVPSRMNMGQMWEVHLSLAAEILGIETDSEAFNCATPEDVAMLLQYAWDLANTESIGNNYDKVYNRAEFDKVCALYPELPQELHDMVWPNIQNIIDWREAFNPDGTAPLYDPETKTFYENCITIGFPDYGKLMQEADEKLNVRSGPLDEQYSRTTYQPQKSDTSAKGQREAEMEIVALMAAGCRKVLDEVINEKSDNVGRMQNLHLQQLGLGNKYHIPDEFCSPRSLECLIYLLEACGVKLEVSDDIVRTNDTASAGKYKFNLAKVIDKEFGMDNGSSSPTDLNEYNDVGD